MDNSTFLQPSNIIAHNLTTLNPYSSSYMLPNIDYNMVDNDQIYISNTNNYNYFQDLEVSDYLGFDDITCLKTGDQDSVSILQTPLTSSHDMASCGSSASASSFDSMPMNNHLQIKCKGREIKRAKREEANIVGFRTRTELETLEDGYKWRKYGKKMVKSNPNPRNYYKCSSVGCKVKKRIERDREDSTYLITRYEGVHNHESPSIIYYDRDHLPFAL